MNRIVPPSLASTLSALAVALVGGCGPTDEADDVSPNGPSTLSPALDPTHEGRTIDGWASALASKDSADRYAAVLALAEFGDEAAVYRTAIEARLGDASASVRWAALETLGRLGEAVAASASVVVGRLDDEDVGVRRAAARAAGRLGAAAAGPLIDRFDRSEDEARAAVRAALVAIGPALVELFPEFDKRLRGEDPTLAEDAADVLVSIGAPAADVLAAAALDPRSLTAVTAIVALGRIGASAGPGGAAALEKAVARKGDVRSTALDALLALGEPGASALRRLASSPDVDLAEAAKARVEATARSFPK